jgi:hypothetical protein
MNENDVLLRKLKITKEHYAYFNHLLPFLDAYYPTSMNYAESFGKLITNPQMEFRYFCYKHIDMFNSTRFHVTANNSYESLFTLFENFPHVEFIIKNTITKLPMTWCHTILCTPKTEEFAEALVKRISPNIKIITIPYDVTTFREKNKLLTSTTVWNALSSTKILLYDEQTCILKNNIDSYIGFDYVGAPWKTPINANGSNNYSHRVGNGSFSLRTREVMLNIACSNKPREIDYGNADIAEHIEMDENYVPPEDVFYTACMLLQQNDGSATQPHCLGLLRLPNADIAKTFSVESVPYDSPFGIHESYIAFPETWRSQLYKHILKTECNYKFDAKQWLEINANLIVPRDMPKQESDGFTQFTIYHATHKTKLSNSKEFAKHIEAMDNIDRTFGFIITRHITDKSNARYWEHSYNCIREFYAKNVLIVFIDDYSDYVFVDDGFNPENVVVIKSTLENRCGEFLPYYYYNQYKFFETATIMHDGMFVNQPCDFAGNPNMFLYEFFNPIDNYEDYEYERKMIKALKHHDKLLDLHENMDKWRGCFGSCSTITHVLNQRFENKYGLSNLKQFIKTRKHRSCFERVLAILFFVQKSEEEMETYKNNCSMFGSIFDHYKQFEYSYDEYLLNGEQFQEYGVIKVWTGR